MTPTTLEPPRPNVAPAPSNQSGYHYDVKLEVGVEQEGGTVPIVAIFRDLVKRMKAAVNGKPLHVLTATDKIYYDQEEMTSDEFQEAFKVDYTQGKTSKVMLGFKLRTMTTLYDIKQRLLNDYLIPNKLFMKVHNGGFHDGIKYHAYGFLKYEHPDHPDVSRLKSRFAKWTTAAWKQMDKSERAKWEEEVPQAFYGNTGIHIPIVFSKERISAEGNGKEKITTSALMVTTPSQYGKILRSLLDIAIRGKHINNLIPLALNKENPDGYFHLVAVHDRFMENHRNIPISNIPLDANTRPGCKGEVLEQLLNGNKDIQRLSFDPKQSRYHISTTAQKYREVHTWITKVLVENRFPYNPIIRPMKFGGSNSQYSEIFADAMSAAGTSYDGITVKSTRRNAWTQRPPLNISYVPTAEAFPPLQSKSKPGPTTGTQSTTSETLDEDTIQSAISSALRKMEEQYRAEMDTLKKEMDVKMKAMEIQMKELGQQIVVQTYQALVTDDSPLATKTDHAQLRHDINIMSAQLNAFITMFKSGQQGTIPKTRIQSEEPAVMPNILATPPRTGKRPNKNRTPEKGNRYEVLYTQDTEFSSATSNLDEELGECEE